MVVGLLSVCMIRYRVASSSLSTISWRLIIWLAVGSEGSEATRYWTTSLRGRPTRRVCCTTRCWLRGWPTGRHDWFPESRPTTRRPSTRRATDRRPRGPLDDAPIMTSSHRPSTSTVCITLSTNQYQCVPFPETFWIWCLDWNIRIYL